MNRPELYQKTIDKLLDAYNNGTLEHGNCEMCAVGNICESGGWAALFCTQSSGYQIEAQKGKIVQNLRPILYGQDIFIVESEQNVLKRARARNVIRKSGYSRKELMKIEFVFETSVSNTKEGYDKLVYLDSHKKMGQFIGLTAVLNVLREIHEVDKEESNNSHAKLKTIAKEKFAVEVESILI